MAFRQYHEVNQAFPAAAKWTAAGLDAKDIVPGPLDPLYPNINSVPFGTYSGATHENWAILLLPFLGHEDLRAQFNLDLAISDSRNSSARRTRLQVYTCPSDEYNTPRNEYVRPIDNSAYARGNYAINGGTSRHCAVPGMPSEPCADGMHYNIDETTMEFQCWWDGVAGINKSFSLDDFRNGCDTTVLLEEVRSGVHSVDPRGVWALGQIGASITRMHGIYGDAHVPNAPCKNSDDVIDCASLIEAVGEDWLIDEKMSCCSYCQGNIQAGARSTHRGGVFVAMLDGSTKFLADSIDPSIWHVLHSREAPKGAIHADSVR